MSDFTSDFWSLYVAGLTVVSIVACGLLLLSMNRRRAKGEADTTGHAWDEDLAELNNPLPMWWIWLFWITMVFGLAYLALYPGLGRYQGLLKWTSKSEYQADVARADQRYGPLYEKYARADLVSLAGDYEARAAGERLFLNYCAQCHASDARGAKGFPNLTDGDWLHGGEPAAIEKTILDGRNGVMPAWAAVLGEAGTRDMANYVRSLSGLHHDAAAAQRAKPQFGVYCAACHGAQGQGNAMLGAPNLADNIWLFGSTEETLVETIGKGRNNVMPAHREFLGEARVHVLAAYVYGLSHKEVFRTARAGAISQGDGGTPGPAR